MTSMWLCHWAFGVRFPGTHSPVTPVTPLSLPLTRPPIRSESLVMTLVMTRDARHRSRCGRVRADAALHRE